MLAFQAISSLGWMDPGGGGREECVLPVEPLVSPCRRDLFASRAKVCTSPQESSSSSRLWCAGRTMRRCYGAGLSQSTFHRSGSSNLSWSRACGFDEVPMELPAGSLLKKPTI
eukprot:1219939-Pyramimonas_sp.AAC.1